MIPLFEYEGKSWSPLGFPMSQNRMAVPVWSYAMEKYPPARIVELGSLNGGFTTVIGLHAWRIGARVISFDNGIAPDHAWRDLATFLGIDFIRGDIFAEPHKAVIGELISGPGISYVLCDNGNKPEEFRVFSQSLKPGDIIAAHDYSVREEWWPWREVTREQVQESVEAHGLEPWMQEHFDMAGWLVYKKS